MNDILFYTLKRAIKSNAGTYGVLCDEKYLPFLNTIERPWNNNKPCTCMKKPCICGSSCIPSGLYKCIRHITSNGRETFQVTEVPGRTEINFDIANIYIELAGCIGLGTSWGDLYGIRGVHNSAIANNIFMKKLEGRDIFWLMII